MKKTLKNCLVKEYNLLCSSWISHFLPKFTHTMLKATTLSSEVCNNEKILSIIFIYMLASTSLKPYVVIASNTVKK